MRGFIAPGIALASSRCSCTTAAPSWPRRSVADKPLPPMAAERWPTVPGAGMRQTAFVPSSVASKASGAIHGPGNRAAHIVVAP
jgi:hypothetical protein